MKRNKKRPSTPRGKPPPPMRMVIRRNAAPSALAPPALAPAATRTRNARPGKAPRKAIRARVKGMRGTHVAAGLGAGTLGNALGVLVVGKGWMGPKTTAGVLIGTGAATTAAGWYWDADHVMAVGTGLAAAGTFSLVNQFAVDAYEAAEKKAKERKAAREKEEKEARIEEARKLAAEEAAKQQQRNGPAFRIEVVRDDHDGADGADDEEEETEESDAEEADDGQDEAAA